MTPDVTVLHGAKRQTYTCAELSLSTWNQTSLSHAYLKSAGEKRGGEAREMGD
jgi:hypothetical protein